MELELEAVGNTMTVGEPTDEVMWEMVFTEIGKHVEQQHTIDTHMVVRWLERGAVICEIFHFKLDKNNSI